MTFGEFIRKAREKYNISLTKLAVLMRVSSAYLSDIERNRRNPPNLELLKCFTEYIGLNNIEENTMYDLAGKQTGDVPPDIVDYIVTHDKIIDFIRVLRDFDVSNDSINEIIDCGIRNYKREEK